GLGELLLADRETHHDGHGDEEDHRRAEQEEDRRRNEIGQEGVALVLVEARRHEHVDLCRHDRERQEGGAEQRDLDLREQIFERRRVDELDLRLRTGREDIGPDQDVVDLLREEEAEEECREERDERLDEARAQLDQVLDQRCARCVDVFLAHASPPSAGDATVFFFVVVDRAFDAAGLAVAPSPPAAFGFAAAALPARGLGAALGSAAVGPVALGAAVAAAFVTRLGLGAGSAAGAAAIALAGSGAAGWSGGGRSTGAGAVAAPSLAAGSSLATVPAPSMAFLISLRAVSMGLNGLSKAEVTSLTLSTLRRISSSS